MAVAMTVATAASAQKNDYYKTRHEIGVTIGVGAGLGLSFMLETQKDDVDGGNDYSDTDVIPNLQLSLIGLEGGTEQIRAFAELGFGEQGILLAGLK